MNIFRKRAQQQFPTVLLTLLSIVQALALELLWEHIQSNEYLHQISEQSLISWLQIGSTILGIILIWVAYASAAMRFRWVPTTGDSVYPFLIGLLEFWQIDMLGPDHVGRWLMLMSVIFAAMVVVSHTTMRKARASGANKDFFREFRPATLKDFIPHIVITVVLFGWGLIILWFELTTVYSVIGLLMVILLLVWQFYLSARTWRHSINSSV